MERAITASEANQRFSEMLRDVAGGETFTVMSRGRAVARVLPVDREGGQSSITRVLRFVRSLPNRQSGGWTRDDCGSACKKDPLSGVIGVQQGPLISMV